MNTITRLKAVREAGRVERVHCFGRAHGSYSNAQHQYGVAMICLILWPGEPDLVFAALTHDTPERWVGDIPSPVLHRHEDFAKSIQEEETYISRALGFPSEHDLTEDKNTKLKAADRLELFLWVIEQERNGNRDVATMRVSLLNGWLKTPPPSEVQQVIDHVLNEGWDRLPENFIMLEVVK